MGFWLGGPSPLGLRRLLIDENGNPRFELRHGERKNIATDRVILIHGPADEVAVVRKIFRMYADEWVTTLGIAQYLNDLGVQHHGKRWSQFSVRATLQSELYIGNIVWARRSGKLQSPIVENHPKDWIRKEHALKPIVSRAIFARAQRRIARKHGNYTNEQLIKWMIEILKSEGKISRTILNKTRGPAGSLLKTRFGSLKNAFDTARNMHKINRRE